MATSWRVDEDHDVGSLEEMHQDAAQISVENDQIRSNVLTASTPLTDTLAVILEGWSVSDNSIDGFVVQRVRFVVYDPPALGLPWLSVCLDSKDRILGVQTFETARAAQEASTSCADRLARKFSGAHVERLSEHLSVH